MEVAEEMRDADKAAITHLLIGMMQRGLSKTVYRFADAPDEPLTGHYGIYINVPFCPTRCVFCPFYAEPAHRYRDVMEEYVSAVIREIEAVYSSSRHGDRQHRQRQRQKTTAALGVLLRAWGRDLRVGVIQFLKSEHARFGEIVAGRRP
ncbi:MAG: cob(I)yrinic acid a,c-diamide adenosyltransferase [Candidatus Roseilinea sp.]|uniref:cob(I)yrinic acid a,c-diamide adenosyltransferase n=1 Tax=Candidatus Roseilinea sp. TaxID=2838777 RepID=UPI00404A4EC9